MRHALLAAALLFSLKKTTAQTAAPFFRNLGIEAGLPSSTVHQVLISKTGHLWAATSNGLARFDGRRFRVLPTAADGKSGGSVASLDEAPDGTVWALTSGGAVVEVRGDSARQSPCSAALAKLKGRFKTPHQLLFDEKTGRLAISLGGLGILFVSPDGQNQELLRPKSPGDMLIVDVGGRWMAESQCFSESEEAAAPPGQPAAIEIRAASGTRRIDGIRESDPKIRLGTFCSWGGGEAAYRNGHLFLLDGGRVRASFRLGERVTFMQKMPLPGSGDGLLMALPDLGLRLYRTEDDLLAGRFETLLEGQIRHFATSATGAGLWAASLENGLFQSIDPNLRLFTGLGGDHVSTIAEAAGGRLFVGFFNGKQVELDPKTGLARPLPAQEPAGSLVSASLFFEKNGTLWSGKRTLARLLGNRWKEVELPPVGSQKGPQPCRASRFLSASPGGERVWACSQQLFACIEASSGRVVDFSTKHGLKEGFEALVEDGRGRVWAGNWRGLFEWKDGQLVPKNLLHPALASGVSLIFLKKDGRIAVATKLGLLVERPGGGFDLIDSEEGGLPSNRISALDEDDAGHLWGATPAGAFRLEDRGEKGWFARRFTAAHGLPVNQVTAVRCTAGRVWLGTPRGLAMLDSGDLPPVSRPVRPVYSFLKINQKAAAPGLLSAAEIELAHDENNLHLELDCPDLRTAERGELRWRLGPEQPWQRLSRPELDLFSLAPGSYALEVASLGAEGDWSEAARLGIRVRPPFWQTWWFRLFAIGLAVGPVAAFYRYRLRILKKEMALREQAVELEKQALRAQMDPHFISNCLNSAQEFILANEREAAAEHLSRFAQLVRQSLDQSFQKEIGLYDEVEYLKNYLSLEAARFRGAFQWEVAVAPELDTFGLRLPPMLVQPFVENAVLHGMRRRTGKGGKLSVRFEPFGEDGLRAIVEDNGPGLSVEAVPKNHRSVGSDIARRRLAAASTDPRAAITVEEWRETDGSVGGVRATISLP